MRALGSKKGIRLKTKNLAIYRFNDLDPSVSHEIRSVNNKIEDWKSSSIQHLHNWVRCLVITGLMLRKKGANFGPASKQKNLVESNVKSWTG